MPAAALNRRLPHGTTLAAATAGLVVDGALTNAEVVRAFTPTARPLDVTATLDAVETLVAEVQTGDLSHGEGLLAAQAASLGAIYAKLAQMAGSADTLERLERLLRMAMRVQSNCGATVETLAALKHPPIVFARQANIAAGPQQVNNALAPARQTESPPIKLLQRQAAHDPLDTGTPRASGAGHSSLAAVGAVDRATHRGRESARQSKRRPRRHSSA